MNLDNTVIKVLNKEHGKRVIQWWKDNGVDTQNYNGTCTESNGEIYIYYGSKDGEWGNWSCGDVSTYNLKVIELPGELTFPRKMLVWDTDESKAKEKLVFGIFPDRISRYNVICDYGIYCHAKEIPVETKTDKIKSRISNLEAELAKLKAEVDK